MSDSAIDRQKVQQWLKNKLSPELIRGELVKSGHGEEQVEEYVKAFQRLKLEKQQALGFYFLLTGAFMGFVSCVLTLVNPVPALYYWILYGLTSLSILVIFVG